ncbi:alpha/beta hydrolase [Mucilaginibacter gynuensis]|uniref:Alpha/beta hydrolase n=1 Tax=Mucilaginibacter gynuensis TaxID=1302236 RepID=A0ABP8FPS8_9SPHI
MKKTINSIARLFSMAALCFIFLLSSTRPASAQAPIKNIVLVHGAFVDGSGWKPVYDILIKKGYNVRIVQHPLTSFDGDVEAVKRVIAMMDGPVILVGHSYGGAVITAAGNDPQVKGLVYIAAHAPDKGENEAANGKLYPPAYKSLQKTADGYDYIAPDSFHADFAADLPKNIADFTGRAQVLTKDEIFHAVITEAAWRTKPSWYMVAQADRIINPDLERMYAKRAASYTVEIPGGSHSVYTSRPKEVAALIIKATEGAFALNKN